MLCCLLLVRLETGAKPGPPRCLPAPVLGSARRAFATLWLVAAVLDPRQAPRSPIARLLLTHPAAGARWRGDERLTNSAAPILQGARIVTTLRRFGDDSTHSSRGQAIAIRVGVKSSRMGMNKTTRLKPRLARAAY